MALCAHACAAFLRALREREKESGIQPDLDVDAFLKASAVEGMRASPVTQFIMRILGLEVLQLWPSSTPR